MVISNYYLSLSGKVKSKFIQDVIELCGISYPSFFYKMRNDSWTKLEREAIERFIQKENEKSSWVLQHAIRLCDVWWRQLYDSAIRIQPGSSGWIAWYYTRSVIPMRTAHLNNAIPSQAKNSRYQKFRIVNRFIRCNCGELDTQKIDFIDGNINIEQVHCPLRGSGDCQYENVICNPKRTSALP